MPPKVHLQPASH